MDLSVTAEVLGEAAERALGAIINKHKKAKGLYFQTLKKLFNSYVLAVMDYGACVWGYKNLEICNKVQNRALRSFVGVHRFVPIVALCGDTGFVPPHIRHRIDMVKMWARILRMEPSRYPKIVYKWGMNMNKRNTWYSELRSILLQCDLEDLLNLLDFEELHGGHTVLIENVKVKLMSDWNTEWEVKLNRSLKLRTYRMFKTEYKEEAYLSVNLNRKQLSILFSLRSGILPIRIETGRYYPNPLPPHDRICPGCDLDVENEIHFVMYCPDYNLQRLQLFNTAKEVQPNFEDMSDRDKFSLLISDPLIIRNTCNYLIQAYTARQNMLFLNT